MGLAGQKIISLADICQIVLASDLTQIARRIAMAAANDSMMA